MLTHRDDEITSRIDKMLNMEDTFELDVRGVDVEISRGYQLLNRKSGLGRYAMRLR